MTLLEFDAVTKIYSVRGAGQIKALDDVSFSLSSGQTIGLVGQSGSGKSTIAKILTQLEVPTSGEVRLDGAAIPRRGKGLRAYRQQLRMVFQDPFASLNPYHSIRYHIERPLRLDNVVPKGELDAEVRRLLDRVRLVPDAVIDRRPHELSGGQRQRIAIARALASRPKMLVADEPVSMLDVSIRLGVLNLLAELQREEGLGVLYITHDLATARHFSDEIIVLNQGRIVERGTADDVILRPTDPYTQQLRAASPDPETFFASASDTPEAPDEHDAPQFPLESLDAVGTPDALDTLEVGTSSTTVVKGHSRIPWRFLGGRALFYLFTLWAAITINFFLPRLMKGDAVDQYLARNRNVSPEAADALRALLGLDTDKSLWQQYIDYWGLLLRGDLGVSLLHGLRPVTEVIAQALPWTIGLVGFATIVSFAIGTIGGAIVGWRRGSKLEVFIPITTFFSTIPYFWLGLLAISVFSVNLGWFPIGKAYGVGSSPEWSLEFIGEVIYHGFLPAATIIIASLGGWMLGMRNMMLTVLDEDYITVAQAKGMPNRRVLWGYAARNAVLPQIQSFALSIGFIVGGTIVMEMVFSYPGVGKLLLDATNAKDYALMQGVFLVITLSVLVANILADIAYAFLDPRTRQSEA